MKQWLVEKRWRIMLAGMVVTGLPVLSIALYVYFEVAAHFEDMVLSVNRQTAEAISNHIEDTIKKDIRIGKLFATRTLIHKAIEKRDRKEITLRLKSFVENIITIERAFITDIKGVVLATNDEQPEFIGKSFSDRDWYKGVSRNWEPYVSEFYLRLAEPKRYLFVIAVPVKTEQGKLIGILVLHPEKDYIKNEIAHIPALKDMKVYAADKKGNLIYHSDFGVDRIIDFSGEPPVKKALKGESGSERITTDKDGAMIDFYHPVRQFGWAVVVQRSEKEVFAPLRRITGGFIIFSALMLILGFAASSLMSNLIFSLKKLSDELEDRVDERTKELRESEELIKLHINRMPIGCITWDVNFRVMSWNPAAEKIFGFLADEAMGRHPYDIIVPKEAQPHVDVIWRRLLEGDETAYSINENITKDGRRIFCEWTNTPLRQNGAVIGVLSMVQDITERKKAEEKIKEQLDYLERFQNVAVKREFRMHELKEENERLKKRIEEMGKK